jgi:hypothetical protein
MTARIAAGFPWVASVLLHVALGLMMLLVTIVLTQVPDKPSRIDPPALTPAERADLNIFRREPDEIPPLSRDDPDDRDSAPPSAPKDPDIVVTDLPEDAEPVIGLGPRTGEFEGTSNLPGFFGIGTGWGEGGDWPGGGKADVVYVLDRSGSMAMGGLFDAMCRELIHSLSGFRPGYQRYHVVFFGDGTCHEAPSRGLTRPTDDALEQTADWVGEQQASGQTDPSKAIRRAFDVLARRRDRKRGAVIFLLTDAAFPDNDALTKQIRRRNRNKSVRIHTILLGSRPAEAVAVMKQIASENGGKYKYVAGE